MPRMSQLAGRTAVRALNFHRKIEIRAASAEVGRAAVHYSLCAETYFLFIFPPHNTSSKVKLQPDNELLPAIDLNIISCSLRVG